MKKALVVVDYQKDFVDGSLGFEGADKIDTKIVELLNQFHQEGAPIVFTMDTHFANYLETREGKILPVEHCIHESDGWELYGETGKWYDEHRNNDNVVRIRKVTFGSADLPMVLNSLSENYDEVHFVGLVSNICVLSNVVVTQASFPHSTMVVHSQGTDSFDKSLNEKVFDILKGLQVTVL